MPPQVHGIEKTKTSLTTVLNAVDTVATNLKDGAQITDLLAVIPLIPSINELVKDIPAVKIELGELSEEELGELLSHFKEKFNLPNGDLAAFIEDVIEYVVDTVAHVKRGIALADRFKTLKAPAPDPNPNA